MVIIYLAVAFACWVIVYLDRANQNELQNCLISFGIGFLAHKVVNWIFQHESGD